MEEKSFKPIYIKTFNQNKFREKRLILERMLEECSLCPWNCRVNRNKGQKGKCRSGSELKIAKALPHFGEEPVLTGSQGSGTIFFTNCNLHCKFCQNYQISQEYFGKEITSYELAQEMLLLQKKGCHNINLVSPVHFLPQILKALEIAIPEGLNIPIVYNSNGYEKVEILKLLEGIIDIYLPDAKYADEYLAYSLSQAKEYTRYNLSCIKEMYRQVGMLHLNQAGIAQRGLIIRHLVLPGYISNTRKVLKSIKDLLGNKIHISLMGQYFPAYQAKFYPLLNHKLTKEEYLVAIKILEELGFENGWIQDTEEIDGSFIPDFTKNDSWN